MTVFKNLLFYRNKEHSCKLCHVCFLILPTLKGWHSDSWKAKINQPLSCLGTMLQLGNILSTVYAKVRLRNRYCADTFTRTAVVTEPCMSECATLLLPFIFM